MLRDLLLLLASLLTTGAQTDAGNGWDPDGGAQTDAGNHWDPDG